MAEQQFPSTSLVSVYHLYTPFTRRMILFSASMLALLTPFTDTIYLPALKNVEEDLDSSEGMVALTVSIYLATVGLGPADLGSALRQVRPQTGLNPCTMHLFSNYDCVYLFC